MVKARRHTQYDRIPRAFIKFLLLAAYHESSIDINNPGLVVGAKKGVFKIFTSDGWDDLGWQSIEHIAPQTKSLGWDQDIYNHDIIHCIGNLVALPPEANSLLNNNSWASKKAMYGALSAETTEAAKEIITTSGLKKTNKLEEITCSFHNPQLASLSMVDEWGVSIIEQRAECLFSRAWDKIFSMLNY